jgi:CDP-2,3-bis-(O-geranylgeranyl)-sn-glycerol synthase
MDIIITIITAFWLMLPAYLPNNFAVVFGGGTPLDFGQTFQDGRRMLGDGKTYRGTIAGAACGILVGLLLNLAAPTLGLPTFGTGLGQLPVLFGLSFGAMLGDIVAAFFKRRLGLKRGAKLFIIDQLDFVIGAWILTMILAPDWFWANFTPVIIVTVLIITPILHRITNIIGYRIGAKREPW